MIEMTLAYDSNDISKMPLDIGGWLKKKNKGNPHCVLCNSILSVRNLHNDRDTHFLHGANSQCPSVASINVSSSYLKNLPKSRGASAHVRDFVRDNLYGVFSRMRAVLSAITWLEFKECCENAKRLQVWDLVDLPVELIPYVLLTCKDSFPVSKYRTHSASFFLEPNPSVGSYWNFSPTRKRIIYEVRGQSGTIVAHEIDATPAQGSVISQIIALL